MHENRTMPSALHVQSGVALFARHFPRGERERCLYVFLVGSLASEDARSWRSLSRGRWRRCVRVRRARQHVLGGRGFQRGRRAIVVDGGRRVVLPKWRGLALLVGPKAA